MVFGACLPREYRLSIQVEMLSTSLITVFLCPVPPKEVIIMDPEGQRLDGAIGPYDEASDLVLICEAEGGKQTLLPVTCVSLYYTLSNTLCCTLCVCAST